MREDADASKFNFTGFLFTSFLYLAYLMIKTAFLSETIWQKQAEQET